MALTHRGGAMIAIVTVLVALSLAAVLLRILARYRRRVRFGMDDYLCFLSAILLLGMLVELVLWVLIGGNGSHQADLSEETIQNFYKIFLANQFTYFALSPLTKISFVCFYRRVFTIPSFQWTSLVMNMIIALWGAAIFVACGLQCRPLSAYWDHTITGTCFDSTKFIIVNQVFNVLVDFAILALPIPMIWNLQRSWQDKLALNGVFAIGGIVCLASIYRIVVLFWIDPADVTYTVYKATLWTHIEPSIGLTCSCLPIIRGLFPQFKLSGARQDNAAYYVPTDRTDTSISQIPLSAAKSPASEKFFAFKLEERADRSLSLSRSPRDISSFQSPPSPLAIEVRTEIDVVQNSGQSIRSHNQV
ncbi:uncharacterized protein DSM5745_05215 [Aspergillus mulundensis]|uniref:Rhodopsin domain-containing protein n=1 Tax=Aspergillus mulundensis TaxID=1810919 RepID=A0A3D8S5V5_9EURO|nr:Uncharacterized protein DSM5745_05215 [Aspergillus mulundensis]RDW81658.1 Uncharacterized protein DSM5745_05215 [Aspergillus mulundensis]